MRSKLLRKKKDWILPLVEDKKVLDLGCVNHTLQSTQAPEWLHGLIGQHSRTSVGVDYLLEEVNALKAKGLNVVCADVETMELHDQFDVVVAGDLIEHLSNPGKFMERVHKHLGPDGVFLLTTPNPVTLIRFVQLFAKGELGVNPEHTSWFTPEVVRELARRFGLRVVEVAWVDDVYQYYENRSKLWLPLLALNWLVCRLFPQLAETMCLRLVRVESNRE